VTTYQDVPRRNKREAAACRACGRRLAATTRGWPGLGKVLSLLVLLLAACSAAGAPTYQVLHSFDGTDGSGPYGGVAFGPDGGLYGTTAGGGPCGTVFELTQQPKGGWREKVLYQFAKTGDGCDPWSSVAFDQSGNLYGGTVGGGDDYCSGGCGTVFQLQPGSGRWTEKIIFQFNYATGVSPTTGVIPSSDGSLYGTAPGDGADGGGVVFKLKPRPAGWEEVILHSFYLSYYGHIAPGGSGPIARPIMDASGNLYSTTREGGKGYGVVYELAPKAKHTWHETVLHRFGSFTSDGQVPGFGAALAMDASGAIYGTTSQGGANICYAGCGTIFELTGGADGRWREHVLYNFEDGVTGNGPNAGVVIDKFGNLYGTTDYGGYGDCGVIYKLAPQPKGKWAYTVLHTFGYGYDGCVPEGNLVMDGNGNLYGGTILGGTTGNGIVFELTP